MEKATIPEKIDLIKILMHGFKHLRRLWPLVLALMLAMSGLNYVRAWRGYHPMYESKATFSVSSGYGSDDVFSSSYYYDNAAAKDLAAAFPHLLSTDMMRDQMLAYLETGYINGSITALSVADTNLFELRVRSSSPQDAYDILNAVIHCYPKVAMLMVENPQVAVRQPPTVPAAPYNPFNGTNAAVVGAMLGAVLGLGIVLLAAILNQTITTPDELKKTVNLPLLGTLPHVTKKIRNRRKQQNPLIRAENDRGLAEAFRGLRTKLHKMLDPQGAKVIMITSTLPSEGKSTVAVNLAMALAAEGYRVALLDADFRNQSIHRMLGKKSCQKNLMDCLVNPRISALQALQPGDRENFFFLSGESTKKRHYQIDTKAMTRVIQEIDAKFDYIVVDSAPCAVVSDVVLLGRCADCLLYVIKQDHAGQNHILESLTSLYERDLILSGCILNDVPRNLLRAGSGYGYGYGYGKSKKYGK